MFLRSSIDNLFMLPDRIKNGRLIGSARGISMRTIRIAGCAALILIAAVLWGIHHHTSQYDYLISQAAARNDLDFYLVKALIFEESWFRPEIRGSAGELGLMQITMAAASDYAVQKGFPPFEESKLLEPEINIEIGCWYLQRSFEHYKRSPCPNLFALLRYNAGESRADHWLKLAISSSPLSGASKEEHYLSLVDFPKTRAYASRILQRARTHSFWH
jgi:soluble lytic murein transglycosylase